MINPFQVCCRGVTTAALALVFLAPMHANAAGPAGVDTDIALWLSADMGVATGTISSQSNVALTWNDLSGSAKKMEALPRGLLPANDPVLYEGGTALSFNFKPVIRYNSSVLNSHRWYVDTDTHTLAVPSGDAPIPITNSTMYVVGAPDSGGNGDPIKTLWGDDSGLFDTPFMTHPTGKKLGYRIYNGDRANGSTSATSISWEGNELALVRMGVSAANEISFSKNGGAAEAAPGTYPAGRNYKLLGSSPVNDRYNPNTAFGRVAEVVIYNNASQSTADRQKIESYLALKYGLALDASMTDYLSSAGTSVYDRSTHDFRVASLAKDGALNKRVSQAATSNVVVTLATENDFTSADADPRASLQEGQYVVMGSDNQSLNEINAGIAAPFTKRIERVWKLQNTGNVTDDIYAKFAGFDDEWELLYSADTDFSSGVVSAGTLSTDGVVPFEPKTGYYTLGARVVLPGPATVFGGLKLWVSADKNMSADAATGRISQWGDISEEGNDLAQSDGGKQPFLRVGGNKREPICIFSWWNKR